MPENLLREAAASPTRSVKHQYTTINIYIPLPPKGYYVDIM